MSTQTKKRVQREENSSDESAHVEKPKNKKQKREEASSSEEEVPVQKLEKRSSSKNDKKKRTASPISDSGSELSDVTPIEKKVQPPILPSAVEKQPGETHEVFSLYFSGLPYETSEEQLEIFITSEFADKIVDIKLPKYQDTGRCKGYAHVIFKDEETMNEVMKLNGQRLGSRYIEI
jgi:nucleolin